MSTNAEETNSSELMKLAFMIFVQVADSQSQVSAREAEVFAKLINKNDWCQSTLLKKAFQTASGDYSRLWKQYTGGKLEISDGVIKNFFEQSSANITTAEKGKLNKDLIHIAEAIAGTAGILGGISLGRKDKKRSIKELDLLLKSAVSVPKEQAPEGTASKKGKSSIAGSKEQLSAKAEEHFVPFEPTSDIMPMAGMTADNAHTWSRGTIQVRCIQTIQETSDVVTFRFAGIKPVLFYFKPGQFITLELEIGGKKVKRSYTISSSPSRPHSLSITVKRVEDGLVSNWLHDNFRVNDTLYFSGPNGRFNCFDIHARKILFLSGGSGITPVMSMARWLYDTGADCDMVFVHSARTPKDIIFRRELELMDAQMSNFRLAVNCTRFDSGEPWAGCTGRLNAQMLEVLAPDLKERVVYLCGPVPFMETTKELLSKMQFPMERFFQESFGGVKKKRTKAAAITTESNNDPKPGVATPVASQGDEMTESGPTPAVSSKVVFSLSGLEAECSEDDSILDIADEKGVEIDSSCRAGSCGTCKVVKLEGEVECDASDGLTDEEIAEGYILTCCSFPQGKVVLEA